MNKKIFSSLFRLRFFFFLKWKKKNTTQLECKQTFTNFFMTILVNKIWLFALKLKYLKNYRSSNFNLQSFLARKLKYLDNETNFLLIFWTHQNWSRWGALFSLRKAKQVRSPLQVSPQGPRHHQCCCTSQWATQRLHFCYYKIEKKKLNLIFQLPFHLQY